MNKRIGMRLFLMLLVCCLVGCAETVREAEKVDDWMDNEIHKAM